MTFIRPIEFNGHVQRTNEVSHLKQQEDNKPVQDQRNSEQTVHRHLEHTMHEVADKENADRSNRRFDAKEKGSNQYTRQEGQRKKHKQDQDRMLPPKREGGIDIKI